MPIRILLTGSNRLLLEGLAGLLRQSEDFEVTGLACDGEDVVAHALEESPDVVLLDLAGMDVKQTVRRLTTTEPTPKVVVVVDEESQLSTLDEQAVESIAAFVRKPPSVADLGETIEFVVPLLVDPA
jgi:DNA-binding NarL/FixJ family response regulator